MARCRGEKSIESSKWQLSTASPRILLSPLQHSGNGRNADTKTRTFCTKIPLIHTTKKVCGGKGRGKTAIFFSGGRIFWLHPSPFFSTIKKSHHRCWDDVCYLHPLPIFLKTCETPRTAAAASSLCRVMKKRKYGRFILNCGFY